MIYPTAAHSYLVSYSDVRRICKRTGIFVHFNTLFRFLRRRSGRILDDCPTCFRHLGRLCVVRNEFMDSERLKVPKGSRCLSGDQGQCLKRFLYTYKKNGLGE